MTSSDDSTPSAGFSRRSVVRAGAHAAWIVPAVTVATAAPAFAQSGILTVVLAQPQRNGAALPLSATITNTDTDTTAAFRVVVTVVPNAGNVTFSTSTSTTPMGFQPSTAMPSGRSAIITYVANVQLGPGDSIVFNPILDLRNDQADGQVTVRAEPGGVGVAGSDTKSFG